VKRIVLGFDGTWNKPADDAIPASERVETNVVRFINSVGERGPDGTEQVTWYDEGVGNDWYDRVAGGAFGAGLEANIIEGYKHLASVYEDDDEVYILGFSRGAYTARSLVGMIRNCGLIHKSHAPVKTAIAYGIYRTKSDEPDSLTARLFRSSFSRPIRIKFVGVWDTVGALGIPFGFADDFNTQFYSFHDTGLSSIVDNAFHAVAIDEHRKNYDACLWDPAELRPGQRIEQRWFAGAHSDVGGGYPDRRLSDITLWWMQDQASSTGLGVTPTAISDENCCGGITDSYEKFLGGKFAEIYPRFYRSIGRTRFGNEVVDDSVPRRRDSVADYLPRNCAH
jgi:uncharacterized protein (DUF2235 family)